ncbi:MAG: arylsulfatase [Planctomycetota bacterium]
MHRLLCIFVFVIAVSASATVPATAQDSRPNILLVLFDDVGFTDFGAYGGYARTPTIDALARQGTKFSRFYSSPFCGPSRAMLLTGMDNHQVGMGTLVETVTPEMQQYPGYSMKWKDDQKTMASLLSKAGYQTFVTGKWGIGKTGVNLPNRFGFDRSYVMDATGGSNYDAKPYLPGYDDVSWFEDGEPVTLPNDYYSSRSLVDKLIEYVDARDADKPFFGFLSLQAVHIPVQAPTSFIDGYDGEFDAGWDDLREEKLQRAIELGLVPATTKLPPPPPTHRTWDDLSAEDKAISAREMQVNAGMLEAADHNIGRLLKHLKKTGVLENTIVIVTSDNGAESAETEFQGAFKTAMLEGIKLIEGFDTSFENLGQQHSLTAIGPEWASVSSAPFHLYKFYGSEGGLRVPLIAAGPDIVASDIRHAPTHVTDLVPTLLDAAGVDYAAEDFYGRSAMPVLKGEAEVSYTDEESFAFEVSGNAALYRGNWKITRLAAPLGDSQWRLYDLSVDPGETTDLSRENPELFEELKAEYKAYSDEVGVFELGPDDSAFKQLFKNIATKSVHKYWPYLVALAIGLCLVVFGFFRLVKRLRRRSAVDPPISSQQTT